MFAIPTGSRLSELSNIISTKAEMTRGPVPSYSDREREIFYTQVLASTKEILVKAKAKSPAL